MAIVGIVSPDADERRSLALLAGESGYQAHTAGSIEEAIEVLRSFRPRLFIVGDAPGREAELLVREVLRAAPLMPVIVALKVRDAGRAVGLMRLGAVEVVAPPWTREELRAVVAKSLRVSGTAISLRRPKAWRWAGPLYLAVVGAFLAAGLGSYTVRRRAQRLEMEASRPTFWDLPYSHPAGLAFDGKDLWGLDWFSHSLYRHGLGDMAVRGVMHFPADSPRAVAFGAEGVWIARPSGDVTRHLRDEDFSEAQAYSDAAPQASCMAYDGLYLWTCDRKARVLRKHLPDDRLSVVAEFALAAPRPVGLAYDGRSLWLLDAERRELLQLNMERPDQVVRRAGLPEYGAGGFAPAGLAFGAGRLWTVAERVPKESGPARLFSHQVPP